MLELKDIKKHYNVGGNITKALDGISVSFRKKEFVAILGTSGSGKTTCLNIVGGLDAYDSGDMVINGKSTKAFKAEDWDAYRNNTIGFVFQSYNLISHLGIIENVELGMTLSGVSKHEKKKKALQALEQVGLKEHIHKRPNQLSGGQMQRVAIARALANNPDILLCDEPTGALDTTTSVQIMDLIREVAKDKLVIMVTHNPDIAHEYADRIVEFKDGMIISDSHPHVEQPKEDRFQLKKTSMSFLTALKLSFNNIRTKKGRTALTAFASSIGIIGIALILSLSGGFQIQIDKFQTDSLSNFPITITQTTMDMDMETMSEQSREARSEMMGTSSSEDEYPDAAAVYPYDPSKNSRAHTNNFSDEYIEYLEEIDPGMVSSVGYTRTVGLNLLMKKDGKLSSLSSGDIGFSSYPKTIGEEDSMSYIEQNYDLLAGKYPEGKNELVLVISTKNTVPISVLKALGLDAEAEEIPFDEILSLSFRSVKNNDYYAKTNLGIYTINPDFEAAYNSENSEELKIAGIIRQKEDVEIAVLGEGIAYADVLATDFINDAAESDIVKAQEEADFNILTGESFSTASAIPSSMGGSSNSTASMMGMMGGGSGAGQSMTKDALLSMLGATGTPYMINIYPVDFESKEAVKEYLNTWNNDKEKDEAIYYTDLAATMTDLTGGIMDAITLVLIAFAAISLVVSLIMIAIITYTSVLERTKEIGILKALGARKKDITRVFDAETFILGVFSGCLGIAISYLLTFPINSVIEAMTDLPDVAQLKPVYAISLIAVSTVLTMMGGHIPAKMAAKKDAVEALRSE